MAEKPHEKSKESAQAPEEEPVEEPAAATKNKRYVSEALLATQNGEQVVFPAPQRDQLAARQAAYERKIRREREQEEDLF